MTKRREFPRSVRVAVIKRATRNGVVYCELCGLPAKKFQVDHARADGLAGDPTLENAQLLGECCYVPKNADDAAKIAKARRREAAHLGAWRPAAKIASRGFTPSQRSADRAQRDPKTQLPRRTMFVDEKTSSGSATSPIPVAAAVPIPLGPKLARLLPLLLPPSGRPRPARRPSPDAHEDGRQYLIDELMAEGSARAETGLDALNSWLAGLPDDELSLVRVAQRAAWREQAGRVRT
jgi:hypothetical protein